MNKNWIKYIQTARRSLGLRDEEYVSILLGAAGVDSATKIVTEKQFMSVKKVLASLGFQSSPLQYHLQKRAKELLGKDWKNRLAGYCKSRFGKSSIYQLTHKELRSVMGFLNGLDTREGDGK